MHWLYLTALLAGAFTLATKIEPVHSWEQIVLPPATMAQLRALSKYAVRAGGCENHREGLWDMVLVKDNHVALAGGIGARRSRSSSSWYSSDSTRRCSESRCSARANCDEGDCGE